MVKSQVMKVLGGVALVAALVFNSASNTWAQNTTALPAPPNALALAPGGPPDPGGPPPAPGGPPPAPGHLPGGPDAMANTQEGAVREISHAYQIIAEASRAISTTADIDALADQMVEHGKTIYGQAYTSYNDKNWFTANETAKAAVAAADTANHIAKSANSASMTVPDLQAPPVITESTNITGPVTFLNEPQHRATDELTHSYMAILMAKAAVAANTDLPDGSFYLTSSETLYKSAYAAYTAKTYDKAAELAHAAHSATDVITHLANAATGGVTPAVPAAPPAPNF